MFYGVIQKITLAQFFLRHGVFRKRYTQCTMGSGQNPRSWWIFEIFCFKSNITVCNVTFEFWL